jgi:hypothetical protein
LPPAVAKPPENGGRDREDVFFSLLERRREAITSAITMNRR